MLLFTVLGFSFFAEQKYTVDRVNALDSKIYQINLTAGTRAEVKLVGDGDTDLDLYVYDSNGRLVVRANRYHDDEFVSWTAGSTGTFTIEVKNLGGVYNQFQLWINTTSPAASLRASGEAHYNAGRYDAAIADYTEAIRLYQTPTANPYRHRAYAYMQKGNFTQASADVNRALQINPNYQSAKDLDAELKRRGY